MRGCSVLLEDLSKDAVQNIDGEKLNGIPLCNMHKDHAALAQIEPCTGSYQTLGCTNGQKNSACIHSRPEQLRLQTSLTTDRYLNKT